jgi:urease accessory protein
MRASLLLLADSRLPAGGHAHSGGVEAAVSAGLVGDLAELEAFLLGRLATAGLLAGAVAAYACRLAARGDAGRSAWEQLDGEVSARTPSPAQREASRAQGRALCRVVGRSWAAPELGALGPRPHAAVALGVATAGAGGTPLDAATLALTAAVTGPASAALRLLGLDPVEVTALSARLAGEIDRLAVLLAGSMPEHPAALPAPGSPALDVLAEAHLHQEVRLFAS